MAQSNFRFISDASGGDQFTVVSFSGNEAISSLYQYEIELKSPLSAAIDIDDVLDSPASFITDLDGGEYPVYGVLSSIDELRTVQGYVYYRAVLVPRLWRLSLYKTNEIYTQEQTVDQIILTVLENAGFSSGTDFDLAGLDDSRFLERDYVCQFGESDLDFISRLMENEGIFYYFEHGAQSAEKIIFINDMNYFEMPQPELIFEVTAQARRQHDCIDAWSCRKQRLPAAVTVRDFNPDQPSLDISNSMPIDQMGQGTEYIYGEHIKDNEEASYLSEIRAEERLCTKTRYYGESSVTRLQAGYIFALGLHPNEKYNGVEYLTVEVNHSGHHLDMVTSTGPGKSTGPKPQYRNSFVAIEASVQFRPERRTARPRFYGTMNAFVYAETGSMNAEIDELGRYRVHLPFDRSDGTMVSTDPDRKASAWIRMAQPYVGREQGMYYPLAGDTEVLLTFINGDPDQPVISAALPNASQPSLLTSEMNFQRTITTQPSQTVTGNTHRRSLNSARIALMDTPPPAPDPTDVHCDYINQKYTEADLPDLVKVLDPSMIPPWDGKSLGSTEPGVYDEDWIKFRKYDKDITGAEMKKADLKEVSTDRGAGDNYVYANARTFAYPQHERVYFIGTFHEDFHVKDDFITQNDDDEGTYNSWTGIREQFNFPAPGEDFPKLDDLGSTEKVDPTTASDDVVNPYGIRGVSEDKRWGDQMFYAYGRQFNWCGGTQLPHSSDITKNGGAFGIYNYGNGYTENLQIATGGTSADLTDTQKSHHDDYLDYTEFTDSLGSTSVVKTFGPTYSYQNGFSLDIKAGDSHSKIYGESHSETHGDSYSETDGYSHSIYHGNKVELLMGTDTELKLAADTEVKLSGDFTFHGGIETTVQAAAVFSLAIGFDVGYQAAGFLKLTTGIGIDKTGSLVCDNSVDLEKAYVKIANEYINLAKNDVKLAKSKFRVAIANAVFFG